MTDPAESSDPAASSDTATMTLATRSPSSYEQAGVDVAAGDRAVELMKASVERATRPEVVGGLGGFAGLFDASALKGYRRPLLAAATDGVGTKVAIAQAMDVHDTIGRDLVAMVVDDLVVTGAEPLFLTDYIACGHVVPERIAAIVSGIAAGCVAAGCALVGGETAEHPGVMEPDEYDLAAAGTGVVEADAVLGAHRVKAGDVLVAMPSSGLHSNGYSLARGVLLAKGPARLGRHFDDLGRTLGEELLEPTRIYALDCLNLARAEVGVRAFAHITGGGLAANVARVVPPGLTAVVDRSSWRPGPIFYRIAREGRVSQVDMERAFNVGVGMVAIVDPDGLAAVFTQLEESGMKPWIMGQLRGSTESDAGVTAGDSGIVLVRGDYAPG